MLLDALGKRLRWRLDGRRWTCMSCQELWNAKRCKRCHRLGATRWLTVHRKGTAFSVSVDIFLKLWNFRVTRLSSKHVLISWIVLKTSSSGIGGVLDWISCFFSGLQQRKGQWLLLSKSRYCRARWWSSLSGLASVRAVNLCSSKSIIVTTKWCRSGVVLSLALELVHSFDAAIRVPSIEPGPWFKWTTYSMSKFKHLMLSSWRRRRAAIALSSWVCPISSRPVLFWYFLPLWRFSVSEVPSLRCASADPWAVHGPRCPSSAGSFPLPPWPKSWAQWSLRMMICPSCRISWSVRCVRSRVRRCWWRYASPTWKCLRTSLECIHVPGCDAEINLNSVEKRDHKAHNGLPGIDHAVVCKEWSISSTCEFHWKYRIQRPQSCWRGASRKKHWRSLLWWSSPNDLSAVRRVEASIYGPFEAWSRSPSDLGSKPPVVLLDLLQWDHPVLHSRWMVPEQVWSTWAGFCWYLTAGSRFVEVAPPPFLKVDLFETCPRWLVESSDQACILEVPFWVKCTLCASSWPVSLSLHSWCPAWWGAHSSVHLDGAWGGQIVRTLHICVWTVWSSTVA